MRNCSDQKLRELASKISSELTTSENTSYSYGGRSFGYTISREALVNIVEKYAAQYDMTEDDIKFILPLITSKSKTKATLKATGFEMLNVILTIGGIALFLGLIVSLF